ncbi:hypothetical protein GAYE_HPEPCTG121G0121 [Galdieria yellowstonensis]|uniref:GDT1 family protein n=1 Tax=Galdieria yellowstonensis TaxID=3028027 RepID=A0AAV9I2Y9_9RHOD|nr:hypothetical protein GAYE_HPEPCTG121G0121 [Galdieria yellowstonensis]
MAFLVDGAKLVCGFSPPHYFRNRISIYSSHRKLGKCFNKTRRARNLVIFSCSDHKEEVKKSSFPHKPVFVSLVLRLFHYIRLCYSSYRRSRFLLRPYSCSCLALLVSTTVRRGFFSASPFLSSLIEALTMVFMSELGDKSMFATALLATRYRPWLVFLGAMIALTMMTGIACFLGNLMHFLPAMYTHYGSIFLFVYFGIQMIRNSFRRKDPLVSSSPEKEDTCSSEYLDAQKLVGKLQAPQDSILSVLVKIFLLIFTAEWCDRSMLATMALASSHSPLAIISGATLANLICSGIAVIGATLLSSKISERKVSLIGGFLFLFFGIKSWIDGPEEATE